MTSRAPQVRYSSGQELNGFRVSAASELRGLRSVAYELEHEKSGARLLHIHSADAENLFYLAEVYCDAVFCPNLTEATFMQEGHHYELADKDDPNSALLIKGIVY